MKPFANWGKLDWVGVANYVASGGLGAVFVMFGTKGAAYGSIVTALAGLIVKSVANSNRPAPAIVAGAPVIDPNTSEPIGTNTHKAAK